VFKDSSEETMIPVTFSVPAVSCLLSVNQTLSSPFPFPIPENILFNAVKDVTLLSDITTIHKFRHA
jgi:hypothetical protein